jgi:hypothetical protein
VFVPEIGCGELYTVVAPLTTVKNGGGLVVNTKGDTPSQTHLNDFPMCAETSKVIVAMRELTVLAVHVPDMVVEAPAVKEPPV